MSGMDWEWRYNQIRRELGEQHDTAQELADSTADSNRVRFHRGQIALAASLIARMDELAGDRAPQA